MQSTASVKAKDIKRQWQLIDARDQILGRMATRIATLLLGKGKPYFVPHMDCGDYVVVVNAGKVKTTGRKQEQKQYSRYSGYPGGLKKTSLAILREKKPTEVIKHAVRGMMPHNKLGRQSIKKLFVFEGGNHPYQGQVKS
ncbi:50S ribosomal protein L13 [Candidatus Daviesbacteria bacterium]|nr:50S ribosomal protein L13 [Candidatus Daviesbacteria bacterium]